MRKPQILPPALLRKRAEIAGEIKQMERAVRARKAALASIDETIRVFAPGFNTRAIKPIRPRRKSRFFAPGEVSRLIRDYMRVNPGPVTVAAIAGAALTAKGLPPDMLKPVSGVVLAALKAMAKTGGVAQTGAGKDATWTVSGC
jgi:hypothetical protein